VTHAAPRPDDDSISATAVEAAAEMLSRGVVTSYIILSRCIPINATRLTARRTIRHASTRSVRGSADSIVATSVRAGPFVHVLHINIDSYRRDRELSRLVDVSSYDNGARCLSL